MLYFFKYQFFFIFFVKYIQWDSKEKFHDILSSFSDSFLLIQTAKTNILIIKMVKE